MTNKQLVCQQKEQQPSWIRNDWLLTLLVAFANPPFFLITISSFPTGYLTKSDGYCGLSGHLPAWKKVTLSFSVLLYFI